MRKRSLLAAFVLTAVATADAASVRALKFSTLDFPGARITEAAGINNVGQIVGSWEDPVTRLGHGFLFSAGVYTSIDVPGALFTVASGINDRGDIVGTYYVGATIDTVTEVHGFVLAASGQFTTITFPGQLVTSASGINNLGQIVGEYIEIDGDQILGVHGFLLQNGNFTQIDSPFATANPMVTFATRINDAGDIVGGFNDDDVFQSRRGYVLRQGTFSRVDVPGSTMTDLFGTNNAGEIVGIYQDAKDGQFYSFLFSPRLGFSRLPAPGASKKRHVTITATDINDAGMIVGALFDGSVHGFVAAPPSAR